MRADYLEAENATQIVVSDRRHMRRLQTWLKQKQLEAYTKMHPKANHQSLISDVAVMTQVFFYVGTRTSPPEYAIF